MSTSNLQELLSSVVSPERMYLREKIALIDSGVDPANLAADIAVQPESTEQVSQILSLCNTRHFPVVTQGGRTGLCGAANAGSGELILMTDRLDAIHSMDIDGGVAVVGAGVTLEDLNNRLLEHGWSVGIDLGARGSATIGGMVSTNAGGNEAFRNGVMRHRVLGLEAVMADGSIFTDLGKVSKNNDGYDIKQLLIGSEGTLGVITKVALKLVNAPEQSVTALCSCESAAKAIKLLNRVQRDKRIDVLAAECMWQEHARTVAGELSLDSLLDFFLR